MLISRIPIKRLFLSVFLFTLPFYSIGVMVLVANRAAARQTPPADGGPVAPSPTTTPSPTPTILPLDFNPIGTWGWYA